MWDLKYFLRLETFLFQMEIPSLEAWSLTTVTKPVILLNLRNVVSIYGSEPPLLYVLQSVSLPQDIQAWSPKSKARIKQLSSSCFFIRFSDLQEPPKEVNPFLLPLKWSQPRLSVTVFHGKYIKNPGMTTWPATSMDVYTAWYMVGMIQNCGILFSALEMWCLEALVNLVQSRSARCIFPELLILKVTGPLSCSDQFPLLCICQCFSNQKLRFDILHPLNLRFLSTLCFKGRFLISPT